MSSSKDLDASCEDSEALPARDPVKFPSSDFVPSRQDVSASMKTLQELSTAQVRARSGIVARPTQRGNELLRYIRNVPMEFGDIVPDYLVGQFHCALFLSLRYHLLHTDYIYVRVRELGMTFRLRILLVLVDVEDYRQPVIELTKLAILSGLSLMCVSSYREAARCLETFRIYENKSSDDIQEKPDEDYFSKVASVLASVRAVNRTDSASLTAGLGSLRNIMLASKDQLQRIPGLGDRKVKRLYEAFHEPLRKKDKQVKLVVKNDRLELDRI